MNEKVVLQRVRELAEVLKELPPDGRPRASRASQASYVPQEQPTSNGAEDLLDHLRLQVKYLLFDLEATRRENRYLREMLERRSNFGEGTDPI